MIDKFGYFQSIRVQSKKHLFVVKKKGWKTSTVKSLQSIVPLFTYYFDYDRCIPCGCAPSSCMTSPAWCTQPREGTRCMLILVPTVHPNLAPGRQWKQLELWRPMWLKSAGMCSHIFANQVSDLLTLTNPLADLVSDYRICSEIPGHPIKLHSVNNMKTIWLKCLSCYFNGPHRILAWIT